MSTFVSCKDIQILVVRKKIRSLRLSIKPNAAVVLSAPLEVSDEVVDRFLSAHYEWIVRSRAKVLLRLEQQQSVRYESGETHLLWGRPLTLQVLPTEGQESVVFDEDRILMSCHSDRTSAQRRILLYQAYYQQFRPVFLRVFEKWADRLDEHGISVSIQLMKSQWGSCMPRQRKMSFNVDLVRLPVECLEYVVIHEYSHLVYCNHSSAFWCLVEERLSSVGLENSQSMRARMKQISCGQ